MERDPERRTFGQRHPVLGMVLIVFVGGLLCGAIAGRAGNALLSALTGGVGGAILFLLLTSVPALLITVLQSICRGGLKSFGSRFMRNLEGTMEFLLHGWS